MGVDKARLELDGESLVAAAYDRLTGCCSEVLVADRDRGLVTAASSVADGPGSGPAAGILGAHLERPQATLLVLACDLPAVTSRLLGALTGHPRADWVVPRWDGRLEPLCALYRPRVLLRLAAAVADNRFALHLLAEEPSLQIHYLEGPELESLGEPRRLFWNLNHPRDLDGPAPG